MVFHTSVDSPLWNGFTSIHRLPTVQWFSSIHRLSTVQCIFIHPKTIHCKWFFIHRKTVHCTMVFHPSKECPLYYGFSSIQRLSTVLWFSFTQNQFLQFPLSCTLSPWLLTLGPNSPIHLSLCLPFLRVPSASHSVSLCAESIPCHSHYVSKPS